MSFQKIHPIEDADTQLDIAFRNGKNKAEAVKEKLKQKGKLTLQRVRDIERGRYYAAADTLIKRFRKIVDSFPRISELNRFYQELIDATLDTQELKKNLASISWAAKKINEVHDDYRRRLNRSNSLTLVNSQRKAFYGRLSSICKSQNKALSFLEGSRKTMKTYPVLKELPTIAIAGFPNVGKTTLLSKLSSSKPEIAEYAFTTKHVNIGYLEYRNKKIQLLDTPGTLAREKQMNPIEKQAELAIKYLAEVIVYIFDPTEPYPLPKQVKLLEIIKNSGKKVILYMSKSDSAEKSAVDNVMKLYPKIIYSAEKLKPVLLSSVFS